jgi:hypothetical protein
MKKQLRQSILIRDGNRCRCCETSERLEVHHLIARKAAKEYGINKKDLDRPENLITLCKTCHYATYSRSVPRWFFTPQQTAELRELRKERGKLSLHRQQLKDEFNNVWDAFAYESQKQKIDSELKRLQERENEIRKEAAKRMDCLLNTVKNLLTKVINSH